MADDAVNLGCGLLADGVAQDGKGLLFTNIILEAPSTVQFKSFADKFGAEIGLDQWEQLTDLAALTGVLDLCWIEGRINFIQAIHAMGKKNEQLLKDIG
jgi:hypothetical protein